MCQCGCIESGDFWKLPGPNKSFYVLQKYPGCKDCDSPMGLIVTKYYPKDFKMFDVKYHKDFPLRKKPEETGEIEFLSRKDLSDKLKKFLLEFMAFRENDEPFDDIEAEIVSEDFCDEIIP